MKDLPEPILSVLRPFANIFQQQRTFQKATWLLIGCLLCVAGVTVCAALRACGMESEKNYSRFHRLLNRDRWNLFKGARILLGMILEAFPTDLLLFSFDDTIERRRGKKIKAKGIFKDPVGTGNGKHVTCSGLRWVPVMVIVKVPFMDRSVALPFLTIPSLSEKTATKLGRRHKSPQRIAEQVCYCLRRWFPRHTICVVADAGYTTTGLYRTCQKLGIHLVTRPKTNLRFCERAPKRTGKRGRPKTKGNRLPALGELARYVMCNWRQCSIETEGGEHASRWVADIDCLWDPAGETPIPVRLVLVKNPMEDPDTPLFCLLTSSTELSLEQVASIYGARWSQEITHRDAREHLGVETQRQWSDLAIERSTPLLFGMYSLVFLIANKLHAQEGMSAQQSAWHQKKKPAFSDLIRSIRRLIRAHQLSSVWSRHRILQNIPCPRELLSIIEDIGMAA